MTEREIFEAQLVAAGFTDVGYDVFLYNRDTGYALVMTGFDEKLASITGFDTDGCPVTYEPKDEWPAVRKVDDEIRFTYSDGSGFILSAVRRSRI